MTKMFERTNLDKYQPPSTRRTSSRTNNNSASGWAITSRIKYCSSSSTPSRVLPSKIQSHVDNLRDSSIWCHSSLGTDTSTRSSETQSLVRTATSGVLHRHSADRSNRTSSLRKLHSYLHKTSIYVCSLERLLSAVMLKPSLYKASETKVKQFFLRPGSYEEICPTIIIICLNNVRRCNSWVCSLVVCALKHKYEI